MIDCRVSDRTPEVDNLESILEKFWSHLGWRVHVHTTNCRCGGLINMNLKSLLNIRLKFPMGVNLIRQQNLLVDVYPRLYLALLLLDNAV